MSRGRSFAFQRHWTKAEITAISTTSPKENWITQDSTRTKLTDIVPVMPGSPTFMPDATAVRRK
jgi:hypothetical protein